MIKRIIISIILLLCAGMTFAGKGILKGKIIDKETQESLPGASVIITGTSNGTAANLDGEYELSLPEGFYEIAISYVSYNPAVFKNVQVKNGETTQLDASLELRVLDEVIVMDIALKNTEASVITSIRNNVSVSSGISSQQISKTQDRNAAEVIRRTPGVIVTENRFINVRGLSQRYNNVYLNNSPTPSSETDIRAFSFDVLPSSQIENMLILKSPMANIPADFSGGFIKIETKSMPDKNEFSFSYNLGYRTGTTFNNKIKYQGSNTDWLGFDNGSRKLPDNFPKNYNNLNNSDKAKYTSLLNQNWKTSENMTYPEQRLSAVLTRRFDMKNLKIGNFTAINYSNSYQTQEMFNARYGIYNATDDISVFSKKYNDTVYNNDNRVSALFNWVFLFNGGDKIEFSNFFNQSGRNKTTLRSGTDYSNDYEVMERELYYSSRTTYSGQLSGKHNFKKNTQNLIWTASYSFAKKEEPDRKIIVSRKNNSESSSYFGLYSIDGNDIKRNFQKLKENILYFNTSYTSDFEINTFKPTFETGISLEYRNRNFNARNFTYDYGINRTNPGYAYLPFEEIVSEQYIFPGGTTLEDKTNKSDSYDVRQILPSAYISLKIPFSKKFNAYIGLRYENNLLEMNSYESDGTKPVKINEIQSDFFPSASLIYNLNKNNLIRAAYGRTVNRPEFRELAPYVYYDFDLFANFEGNPELKNAYAQNLDLRYEFYPSASEMIAIGVFYKSFTNPIEITYFYTGSQLQYSFENAEKARNLGAEIELRTGLDIIGLNNFTFVINAALINSKVYFDKKDINEDRSMQGQAPYLVNAAIFYEKKELGLSMNLQYNIIGKRIVVLGEANQDPSQYIPNTYEMPRNVLDFSISKSIGKYFEIKGGIKDIFNSKVIFKQFPTNVINGEKVEREQITRSFLPGRIFSLGISMKF